MVFEMINIQRKSMLDPNPVKRVITKVTAASEMVTGSSLKYNRRNVLQFIMTRSSAVILDWIVLYRAGLKHAFFPNLCELTRSVFQQFNSVRFTESNKPTVQGRKCAPLDVFLQSFVGRRVFHGTADYSNAHDRIVQLPFVDKKRA